jgi:opacity protein-like surface antigen
MNHLLKATAIAVGMVAVPTAASAESQWRVFGGLSDVGDFDYAYGPYTADLTTDTGFVVGAAYGAVHGNWVLEGELSFRGADFDTIEVLSYSFEVDGDVSALSLMANAWYHFPTNGNWGFYAGGGVGFASAEADLGGTSDDSTEFAWQLGGGVNYRTEQGFAYGLGYRYFNISEVGDTAIEVNAHEFIFEISSRF